MISLAFLKNVVLLLLSLYVMLGAALYIFQRSFIYFPTYPTVVAGLAEVSLTNDAVQLQGLIANPGRASLLLYFGGNAEQIGTSLQQFTNAFPALSVAGFHYRGYSGSEGEPSEKALYSDALAIYDALAADYGKVIVVGRSLGSGVATYLVSQRAVAQLILITPFDSITAIAADIYWFYPVKWMLWDSFASIDRASIITAPTLILIAAEDQVVPPAHSLKLFNAFNTSVAEYHVLKGVEHNNIGQHEEFITRIGRFILSASG